MQKFTIIYTPTIDYEFMQQRPQRIMEQFAREGHQVLYMNQREQNLSPREVEPNLWVIYRHDDVLSIQKQYPTVLWMSWAFTHDWVERLNPNIAVYDCLDDFADWRSYEEIIVNKVQLVTTTAELLHEKMIKKHNNVVMVKNGCEYEHFDNVNSFANPSDLSIPSNLKRTVGYVGALGHWVDSELITKLADDFNIIMIGPHFGMPHVSHPHVQLLGLRDYKVLPSYIKHFEALIIPFLINDITLATNPIKMYEYLATGKPVIASGLPEAKLHPEVLVGETHDQFISIVKDAVDGKYNSQDEVNARKQVAMNNSWKQRYETIYTALRNTFQTK